MNRLRTKVDFPDFKPHVTLASVIGQTELTPLQQIAEQLAQSFAPFRVQSEKISGEEHPYRCLYIKLKKSRLLLDIRQMVFRQMNRSEEDAQFYNPHISLVYGTLKKNEKKRLAEEVDFPENTEIVLNRIAICHVAGTPKDWKIAFQDDLNKGSEIRL
ncbi:MAG: 2'-5' RNA ligase family protein [Balneolaceae bacterium]